jgi:hypothetical protein
MSWECPKIKSAGVRGANIYEAQQRNAEVKMKAEVVE